MEEEEEKTHFQMVDWWMTSALWGVRHDPWEKSFIQVYFDLIEKVSWVRSPYPSSTSYCICSRTLWMLRMYGQWKIQSFMEISVLLLLIGVFLLLLFLVIAFPALATFNCEWFAATMLMIWKYYNVECRKVRSVSECYRMIWNNIIIILLYACRLAAACNCALAKDCE